MPDTQPIRVPSSSQRVESPPRRRPKPADPCAMVIFGAGGDLTKRLVVPALYNLVHSEVLPENFALIGVGHSEGTAEQWRDSLHAMLKSFVGNKGAEFDADSINQAAWKRLADKMTYIAGDFTKPEIYGRIGDLLREAEGAHGTKGNAIFYLAVADQFFGTVVDELGKAKLTEQGADAGGKPAFWRRVVIEKPFGHSVQSARDLNTQILRTLHEDQIFRIDHFLGKDSVQSIMAVSLRQRPVRADLEITDRIDHVQITAAQVPGGRRRTPRQVLRGDRRAARRLVPNHVFHNLSLSMVAMEPPTCFEGDAIRKQEGRGAGRHAVGQAVQRECTVPSNGENKCWASR